MAEFQNLVQFLAGLGIEVDPATLDPENPLQSLRDNPDLLQAMAEHLDATYDLIELAQQHSEVDRPFRLFSGDLFTGYRLLEAQEDAENHRRDAVFDSLLRIGSSGESGRYHYNPDGPIDPEEMLSHFSSMSIALQMHFGESTLSSSIGSIELRSVTLEATSGSDILIEVLADQLSEYQEYMLEVDRDVAQNQRRLQTDIELTRSGSAGGKPEFIPVGSITRGRQYYEARDNATRILEQLEALSPGITAALQAEGMESLPEHLRIDVRRLLGFLEPSLPTRTPAFAGYVAANSTYSDLGADEADFMSIDDAQDQATILTNYNHFKQAEHTTLMQQILGTTLPNELLQTFGAYVFENAESLATELSGEDADEAARLLAVFQAIGTEQDPEAQVSAIQQAYRTIFEKNPAFILSLQNDEENPINFDLSGDAWQRFADSYRGDAPFADPNYVENIAGQIFNFQNFVSMNADDLARRFANGNPEEQERLLALFSSVPRNGFAGAELNGEPSPTYLAYQTIQQANPTFLAEITVLQQQQVMLEDGTLSIVDTPVPIFHPDGLALLETVLSVEAEEFSFNLRDLGVNYIPANAMHEAQLAVFNDILPDMLSNPELHYLWGIESNRPEIISQLIANPDNQDALISQLRQDFIESIASPPPSEEGYLAQHVFGIAMRHGINDSYNHFADDSSRPTFSEQPYFDQEWLSRNGSYFAEIMNEARIRSLHPDGYSTADAINVNGYELANTSQIMHVQYLMSRLNMASYPSLELGDTSTIDGDVHNASLEPNIRAIGLYLEQYIQTTIEQLLSENENGGPIIDPNHPLADVIEESFQDFLRNQSNYNVDPVAVLEAHIGFNADERDAILGARFNVLLSAGYSMREIIGTGNPEMIALFDIVEQAQSINTQTPRIALESELTEELAIPEDERPTQEVIEQRQAAVDAWLAAAEALGIESALVPPESEIFNPASGLAYPLVTAFEENHLPDVLAEYISLYGPDNVLEIGENSFKIDVDGTITMRNEDGEFVTLEDTNQAIHTNSILRMGPESLIMQQLVYQDMLENDRTDEELFHNLQTLIIFQGYTQGMNPLETVPGSEPPQPVALTRINIDRAWEIQPELRTNVFEDEAYQNLSENRGDANFNGLLHVRTLFDNSDNPDTEYNDQINQALQALFPDTYDSFFDSNDNIFENATIDRAEFCDLTQLMVYVNALEDSPELAATISGDNASDQIHSLARFIQDPTNPEFESFRSSFSQAVRDNDIFISRDDLIFFREAFDQDYQYDNNHSFNAVFGTPTTVDGETFNASLSSFEEAMSVWVTYRHGFSQVRSDGYFVEVASNSFTHPEDFEALRHAIQNIDSLSFETFPASTDDLRTGATQQQVTTIETRSGSVHITRDQLEAMRDSIHETWQNHTILDLATRDTDHRQVMLEAETVRESDRLQDREGDILEDIQELRLRYDFADATRDDALTLEQAGVEIDGNRLSFANAASNPDTMDLFAQNNIDVTGDVSLEEAKAAISVIIRPEPEEPVQTVEAPAGPGSST